MSDLYGDDGVREHAYEHVERHHEDEVLHESDVEGFRQSAVHVEESHVVATDNHEVEYGFKREHVEAHDHNLAHLARHEDFGEEENKTPSPPLSPPPVAKVDNHGKLSELSYRYEEAAADINSNHSNTAPKEHDDELGSAKKAAELYQAAITNKSSKANEDDNERSELRTKKRVSDLISKFNTGEVFNQNEKPPGSGYKNDYGVGKVGAINTGRFK